MRNRWLALGGLVLAGCTVAPGPSGPAAPEPDAPLAGRPIRIGLSVEVSEVTVTPSGRTTVATTGGEQFSLEAGRRVTLVHDGDRIRVREWSADVRPRGIRIESRDPVTVNGTAYRGAVEITARASGLVVVNEVPIEAYLASVVGAEMGRRSDGEHAALEAQAIASRTYALKNRGRWSQYGFDLYGSTADQAYGGLGTESSASRRAVRATEGRVVTFDGKLISAFYHSTCGQTTAAPSEVFRSVVDVPYLQPVHDERPDGGFFSDESPWFTWSVEWSGAELTAILRRTLPAVVGTDAGFVDEVREVYVRQAGPSGRAVEVRVLVGGGEVPVFGPDIRPVFEGPDGRGLPSNDVAFSAERDGDRLVRLVAAGRGFGHGVGLCQWGAIGRARAGLDAHNILTTYYRGTTIERWY